MKKLSQITIATTIALVFALSLISAGSANADSTSKKKKKKKAADAPTEEVKKVDPWAPVNYSGHIGLGLELGYPVSLVAKYWLNSTSAIDAAMDLAYFSSVGFHADYLHHFRDGFGHSTKFLAETVQYVGIGAAVVPSYASILGFSYFGWAIRVPLGAEWLPKLEGFPLGIYAEVVPQFGFVSFSGPAGTPGLGTVSGSGFGASIDVGAHYYF